LSKERVKVRETTRRVSVPTAHSRPVADFGDRGLSQLPEVNGRFGVSSARTRIWIMKRIGFKNSDLAISFVPASCFGRATAPPFASALGATAQAQVNHRAAIGRTTATISSHFSASTGFLRDNPFSRQYMWELRRPQCASRLAGYFSTLPPKG
jgi:hypothetical protein